jgi:hypothetical protein
LEVKHNAHLAKPLLKLKNLSHLVDVTITQTSVPLTSLGELEWFEENPFLSAPNAADTLYSGLPLGYSFR